MNKRERGRAIVDWLVYNGYAINRGDLAAKIGYNATVLSAAITGRNNFSDKMAKAICAFNNRLNLEWVLTGEGEMLLPRQTPMKLKASTDTASKKKEPKTTEQASIDPALHDLKTVPFYHELNVSAGQQDMFGYDAAHDLVALPGVDADAYFPVVGMSMQPNIMPGDMIGVKEVGTFERIDPSRVYLIITRQNERMIKHIMPSKSTDEEITLTSDNSDYSAFQIRKEDIHKVMRVVYVGRQI